MNFTENVNFDKVDRGGDLTQSQRINAMKIAWTKMSNDQKSQFIKRHESSSSASEDSSSQE